jgi:ubiquinone/menaquinone biosynthesis C-methylase UbiE
MQQAKQILMRMFGRPEGLLGTFGGIVMARMNRPAAAWGVGLLELRAGERVLEVGFGPGVAIELLAGAAPEVRVAGIDPSSEMVAQAVRRNAAAIARHAVDLREGSADALPFDDDTFDAALAINSLQVWPDASAGLREIRRVAKPGGRVALVFTPRSGQARTGITELLSEAGFVEARLVQGDPGFAALARKPRSAS